MLGTKPPHVPLFLLLSGYTDIGSSPPQTGSCLWQSVISQEFCYCYQDIFIFLGQRHVIGLLTAGDDCAPAARPPGELCSASTSGNTLGVGTGWKPTPLAWTPYSLHSYIIKHGKGFWRVTFMYGTATGNWNGDRAFLLLVPSCDCFGHFGIVDLSDGIFCYLLRQCTTPAMYFSRRKSWLSQKKWF